MFPGFWALNMPLSSCFIDSWHLFSCITGSVDIFHYLLNIRYFSLFLLPFSPCSVFQKWNSSFSQNEAAKEPNKIPRQLLPMKQCGFTQWQCHKEELSWFLCELVVWLFFRIRERPVRLTKVTIRAMFSLRGKEKKKKTKRENIQRNLLKNRCFMKNCSIIIQLKKSCDTA